MAGKARPGVSMLVALVLLVAGAAIIIVNTDHPLGVVGGIVTALVGVAFFIRGVAARKTTPEGRRRFFIS
jgi:uncharacterized membrane protein